MHFVLWAELVMLIASLGRLGWAVLSGYEVCDQDSFRAVGLTVEESDMCRYALIAVFVLMTNVMCSQQQGAPSALTCDSEQGFVALFDGKTLTGWQGKLKDYEAVDGMLICKKGCHGLLYSDGQYSDFVLRLEYRLEPGGNNGIGIRAPFGGPHPAFAGMEIQILDDSAPKYHDLKPVQYNGSIYGAVAAERGHMKPVGEWNAMEIIAKGSRIQVNLNGTKILDVDTDTLGPNRIHNADLKGLHNKTGHIAICGHNHRVEFRNLRVKEI